MGHHVIELDRCCKKCGGTGLYVGIAEHDGAAIVCHVCKGTGCEHIKIEYDDFEGRKIKANVSRVYATNPGITISTRKKGEGKYALEEFGGMSYEDWAKDKPFPAKSENRKFTCPAWWYQSADYNKKPGWNECLATSAFSECCYFSDKDKRKCWERWDKEFGKQDNKNG